MVSWLVDVQPETGFSHFSFPPVWGSDNVASYRQKSGRQSGMCQLQARFLKLGVCLTHAFSPLLPLNEDNSKAQKLWRLKVERTHSLNHYMEKTNSRPRNGSLVCFVKNKLRLCLSFYHCVLLLVPGGSINPNKPRTQKTCIKTELHLWKLSLALHAYSISFYIECRKMNLSL